MQLLANVTYLYQFNSALCEYAVEYKHVIITACAKNEKMAPDMSRNEIAKFELKRIMYCTTILHFFYTVSQKCYSFGLIKTDFDNL